MRIERIVDPAVVHRAADLFDSSPSPEATERFLANPTHHLLFAFDGGERAVGMISGVEMTGWDETAWASTPARCWPAAAVSGCGRCANGRRVQAERAPRVSADGRVIRARSATTSCWA